MMKPFESRWLTSYFSSATSVGNVRSPMVPPTRKPFTSPPGLKPLATMLEGPNKLKTSPPFAPRLPGILIGLPAHQESVPATRRGINGSLGHQRVGISRRLRIHIGVVGRLPGTAGGDDARIPVGGGHELQLHRAPQLHDQVLGKLKGAGGRAKEIARRQRASRLECRGTLNRSPSRASRHWR